MSLKKKEAAEYLGITERALEYHVKQKNISARTETGKHGNYVVFDEKGLRELKAQIESRRAPRHSVSREDSPERDETEARSLMRLSDISPDQFAELLMRTYQAGAAEVLARMPAMLPAATNGHQVSITDLAHKLMLSIPEAAQLSGISAEKLREAAHAGKLKTVKSIGRGLGKVRRADLDTFVKKL